MQAGITDNVPLHVLGGNIIPVALGQQFMITEEVRNASLALIVALPKANSTSTGMSICTQGTLQLAPAFTFDHALLLAVKTIRRLSDPAITLAVTPHLIHQINDDSICSSCSG